MNVDINGTAVTRGARVAVAGQIGQSSVMRVGKVDEVYTDKYGYVKVRVDWREGKGSYLPSTKTSVGLDKVLVLLDRPTASA